LLHNRFLYLYDCELYEITVEISVKYQSS